MEIPVESKVLLVTNIYNNVLNTTKCEHREQVKFVFALLVCICGAVFHIYINTGENLFGRQTFAGWQHFMMLLIL